MNKYAFVENVPELSVEEYKAFFDDGEWYNQIAGLDGVDGIELCSGFDLDMTKQIIAEVESIDKKIPVGSNGITL